MAPNPKVITLTVILVAPTSMFLQDSNVHKVVFPTRLKTPKDMEGVVKKILKEWLLTKGKKSPISKSIVTTVGDAFPTFKIYVRSVPMMVEH